LRYKGRRPLADVAVEVGVSLRTVRRRFDRMAGEGSFFVVPAIDPGKAPGILLYELLFYLKPDAAESVPGQVLRILDERLLGTTYVVRLEGRRGRSYRLRVLDGEPRVIEVAIPEGPGEWGPLELRIPVQD